MPKIHTKDRTGYGADDLPAVRRADPARPGEDAKQFVSVGAAFMAAIAIQRKNEANRSRFQRRIGASPHRQAQEEMAVRVGALAAGTLAYLVMVGAAAGLHQYQDRKARRVLARRVCRVVRAAATAPDGSMPDEARRIAASALAGTGLGSRACQRLLSEPGPAKVSYLDSECTFEEPLLTAVAIIAFCAMAEATGLDDAARRMPTLLRRMGLARPSAEAKAAEIAAEYTGKYLVLSHYYAQLQPPVTEWPVQFRPPVPAMARVAESVIERNPNELARQATRDLIATFIRQGAQVTLNSGVPLNRTALVAVRLVGQLFGAELPALPRQLASAPRTLGASAKGAKKPKK